MSDTLITIIAIFLAAVLMFIFPLMSISERNDDIAQSVIQTATSEFADKISMVGAIKPSDYEEYLQKIGATGNLYDVEMEVQHLDDNPGKKHSVTSPDLIGENMSYSTYTSDILKSMYEGSSAKPYSLKKGDIVTVTAKNTNKTIAQSLRSFFYKVVGKGTYQVAASATALVVNSGTSK